MTEAEEKKTVLGIIQELQAQDELTQKEKDKKLKDTVTAMPAKDFLESLAGTSKDMAGLGTADTKVLVGAIQSMGIDVTEKQEDRARDQSRMLVQTAFLADRNALAKQKEDAKGIDKLGLMFKEGWMKASQKIVTGFFDVQDYIDKQTDFDSLKSAFSQDFSVLTMAFQEIGNIPGMKTIVASVKYLAGWAAKAMMPMIAAVRSGFAAWRKDLFKRRAAKEKDQWQGLWSRMFGKKTHEQALTAQREKKQAKTVKQGELDLDSKPKKKRGAPTKAERLEKHGQLRLDLYGTEEAVEETEKITGKDGVMSKIGKQFRSMGEKIKTGAGKFAGVIKGIFVNKETGKLTKVGKVFKAASGLFRKAIAGIAAAFTGFSLAMLGWVALFVLIVVAFFVINQLIQDNLEKIKVRFKQAVDKFKNTFKKAGNWFKDLGEDIWYSIKMLGARIKDGFASMANKVITKLNKIPGVDIEKWDTGRVEKLEGEHEDVLAGRIDRDQKLLGEYKALSQERGKQLEDAAKADADRKAEKDAGGQGGSQQINTSVQTDAREVHMTSESTQPTDFTGMRANMALDG